MQTDPETIQFYQWQVEIQRKAFRRAVSIYLYPHRPIRVLAGKMTTQKMIVDFLLSKKGWIEKNLEKLAKTHPQVEPKKFEEGEQFLFMGVAYTLQKVVTFEKRPFVSLYRDKLLLHIPYDKFGAPVEKDLAQEQLRRFYRREGERHLRLRVIQLGQQTGLVPSRLSFREQRTRWGSCNSKKAISLNWRLITFAPEIIDYVLIHELAHLKHLNHSAQFWSLVEQYCPDYKRRVIELKKSQYQCEFLAKA